MFKDIIQFFMPKESFDNDEWILRYKIISLLIISFCLGIGVFCFGIYRISVENYTTGSVQIIFSTLLIYGFFLLRKNKNLYPLFSTIFFLFLFIYINIIFFFVPENRLNVLWIITSLVLIFFLLDRKGGVMMLILFLLFFLFLIITDYPYSVAEFITLFATLTTTALILYTYEKVKVKEKERLNSYNKTLQERVNERTKKLKVLNENLELKIKKEVDKRLKHEHMLLRQSRLASMGEMIDSIAHQWRQPLMNINAILMNIDLAIETKKDPEYMIKKIDEAASLTTHMSQTIEDFRGLFKPQKEMSRFDIQDALNDALYIMQNSIKEIKIELLSKESISIYSHKSELIQVFMILLSNSCEVLHLRDTTKKVIYINIKRDMHNIIIEIEDNGGGIDEKIKNRVFEPYFTTKENLGGSGLGLYIAKIIIESNMHGKLYVKNGVNGAKFTIKLKG